MEKIKRLFQKETVFCISFLLALLSMLFVAPSADYIEYIDFRVLAILFCLMVVMKGYQSIGLFDKIGQGLLKGVKNYRQLVGVLVFCCFFSSMLITNDVALITFVPFSILVMKMAQKEEQLIPVICAQTVAANLGSMLTPVGNPQNLYLYSVSGMSIGEFLKITMPITLLSGVLLVIFTLLQKKQELVVDGLQESASLENGKSSTFVKKAVVIYTVLFFVSLLTVLRLVPVTVMFVVVLLVTLVLDWQVLLQADYFLLATFVCFFVFIGNMGNIPVIKENLEVLLKGRELLVSIASSQIISNVPAAVLLSGFTTEYRQLLIGTNLGGLGTLIASLASLISYKCFTKEYSNQGKKYLVYFTGINVLFLMILILFVCLFY